MTASSSMKPKFPESWLQPTKPAYGTFPWPFKKSAHDHQELLRSAFKAITEALNLGYRHIDTAFTYGNQDQMGTAIQTLGIRREEIFVTSKLH